MNLKPSVSHDRKKAQLSALGCYHSYHFMGAHPVTENGVSGWRFRVWAPAAKGVSVVGSFNDWRVEAHPMLAEEGGTWTLFIPYLKKYDVYEYAVQTPDGKTLFKADPYAFHAETRPGTASKLYDIEDYPWGDEKWRAFRETEAYKNGPMNLYEVHLGSWRRTGDAQALNYRVIASYLVPYVKEMGYTGVKLLPVCEHPLDESLGYQLTGYFAVTSRFGTPHDFMYLVDQLHRAGVSVILDNVSTGFPRDDFGLHLFDGTPCYGIPDTVAPAEDEPETEGDIPAQKSRPLPPEEVCEFDTSKAEVRNFLISSAFFWLDKFHVDGIHFTGTPTENAEFISLLNQKVHEAFPYAVTSAGEPEELTGFDHRWYTYWVEQMLSRLTDPSRTGSVFSVAKRPSSTSVLPLSHDLFAAPNPSLTARMIGDDNHRFAQVRAFYLFFLTQTGSKLTFQGTEFGQWNSWNCLQSLDWHLLQYDIYQKMQRFFREMNALYLSTPAFWERDSDPQGLVIMKTGEGDQVTAYIRRDLHDSEYCIAANFSTSGLDRFWLPVSRAGEYEVVFSSDRHYYGGQDRTSTGTLTTLTGPDGSGIWLDLPPMCGIILRCSRPSIKPFGSVQRPSSLDEDN